MRRGILFLVLFVLMVPSVSHAQVNIRSLLNSPEDYEGKTVVLPHAKLDRDIARHRHFGFYCLDIEVQGKHVPGYFYRSQLNFVISSEDLEKKLSANLERGEKKLQGPDFELMDHVHFKRASLVRLTCSIKRYRGYWLADVTKIELYGKDGQIIKTIQ